MDAPEIRPGRIAEAAEHDRVVAYFPDSAPANAAIQLLLMMGVPGDGLGVTPPDGMESHRGMILSIPCPRPTPVARVEAICRAGGATVLRQFAPTAEIPGTTRDMMGGVGPVSESSSPPRP